MNWPIYESGEKVHVKHMELKQLDNRGYFSTLV